MKTFSIRCLNESDRFEVSELRRRMLAPEFPQIEDSIQFNWGPTDRSSWVLGAFHQEALISTIRLETLAEPELFESRMDLPWSHLPLPLPVYLTSRAVTHPDFQRCGLHSILKMICFLKAMTERPAPCLSSHREDTPRAKSLAEMGCELSLLPTLKHDSHTGTPKKAMIAQIDLKTKGPKAVAWIQGKYLKTWQKVRLDPELVKELDFSKAAFPCEP